MSPQDGAYVIMTQNNKLGKFNYLDEYSCSNHIICSFVECYFIHLVQILLQSLFETQLKIGIFYHVFSLAYCWVAHL